MLRSFAKRFGLLLALGAGALGAHPAVSQDFGEPGEPISLTVGYQPYYTQSWSGVVINGKELWKKYLPEGSEVEFQIGLQGAIIVGQLIAEKQQIGYMGDMPAIVSTTKDAQVDIRLVAVLGMSQQQCNIFLVRNDAPEFASGVEAVEWMNGKTVSSPHGSCTDRFARLAFQKSGIEPDNYLNQNIEVITTNFQAGKLDGAVIWEPTASKIQLQDIARRAASGVNFDADDAGFLAFNYDLMSQRPDVLRGWLEAELDAQLFLADPANAAEVTRMAAEQTTGLTNRELWYSLYGAVPEEQGGSPVKNSFEFIFTDRARTLITDAAKFLHSVKSIPSPTLRDDAIMDQVAREVLQERGLEAPVGVVEGKPLSEFENLGLEE